MEVLEVAIPNVGCHLRLVYDHLHYTNKYSYIDYFVLKKNPNSLFRENK